MAGCFIFSPRVFCLTFHRKVKVSRSPGNVHIPGVSFFLLKFSVEVTAVEGCWAAITTHVPPLHLDHKRKSKNPPDTGKFKKKKDGGGASEFHFYFIFSPFSPCCFFILLFGPGTTGWSSRFSIGTTKTCRSRPFFGPLTPPPSIRKCIQRKKKTLFLLSSSIPYFDEFCPSRI
jgi:hypothetical protein